MIMAVNHVLTGVLKDRIVQSMQVNASEVSIGFFDGSTMKIKIMESNSPPLREQAHIRTISEDQAKVLIECEDDSTFDVTLSDPGNAISVRDKNDQVEYLGRGFLRPLPSASCRLANRENLVLKDKNHLLNPKAPLQTCQQSTQSRRIGSIAAQPLRSLCQPALQKLFPLVN
jgi:hypothetical protein